MVVDSASFALFPLGDGLPSGALWDLSLLEGSLRQLKSGTVASKVRGGL